MREFLITFIKIFSWVFGFFSLILLFMQGAVELNLIPAPDNILPVMFYFNFVVSFMIGLVVSLDENL